MCPPSPDVVYFNPSPVLNLGLSTTTSSRSHVGPKGGDAGPSLLVTAPLLGRRRVGPGRVGLRRPGTRNGSGSQTDRRRRLLPHTSLALLSPPSDPALRDPLCVSRRRPSPSTGGPEGPPWPDPHLPARVPPSPPRHRRVLPPSPTYTPLPPTRRTSVNGRSGILLNGPSAPTRRRQPPVGRGARAGLTTDVYRGGQRDRGKTERSRR